MQIKDIKQLDEKLESVRTQLKTEFFGIDEQIDTIIDNVKPWLYFPEILTRPTIINLWGLTGVGKSALVNRLIELIDLKKFTQYFNFGQLDEKSCWEIEEQLNEHVDEMGITTPIFIYDEFQYAKTIDEDGKEVNKAALKIFWELLDSGKFITETSYSAKSTIQDLMKRWKRILHDDRVEVTNGKWIKGKEIFDKIGNNDKIIEAHPYIDGHSAPINEETGQWDIEEFELPLVTVCNNYEKKLMLEALSRHYPDKYETIEDVYHDIMTFDKQGMYDYLQKVWKLMLENVTIDFSKALIFVMGNLDEAYKMVYDSDPDMDADQFHKASKKISIVKIKKALQTRFRVEQIARLGNTHIIYPSFSSDTFKKIIAKQLSDYEAQIKDLLNINLIIDQSVHDIVYKDAVFPTHGARPIFASISEIVKTKLPKALMHAQNNELEFNQLRYEYKDDKFRIHIESTTEGLFPEKEFPDADIYCVRDTLYLDQVLRVEKLRESTMDDEQALTAVHEAGHAVVAIEVLGEAPVKICSIATDDNMGGFTLEEDEDQINSAEYVLNELAILLAGKAAEEIVFEDPQLITNGCYSDYRRATALASDHIRKCGFGDYISVSGWMEDPMGSDQKTYRPDQDARVEQLLSAARILAKNIIKKQMSLLLHLSEYLSTNNEMKKEQIEQFMEKYYIKPETKKSDSVYRDILKEKLKTVEG